MCSSCAPADLSLPAALPVLLEHGPGITALALHREPSAAELRGFRALRQRLRIVAVYGSPPGADLGRPLVVVEGGPADEDREASLLELCRRLHAFRDHDIALRTPVADGDHPAPHEIELVHSELPGVGYFHDAARGGAAYLDAAARRLHGAAFHPLELDDLSALRDALPAAAPAVIECGFDELGEAVRRAQGVFRA